jgi:hypothetical protein
MDMVLEKDIRSDDGYGLLYASTRKRVWVIRPDVHLFGSRKPVVTRLFMNAVRLYNLRHTK